VRVSQQQRKQQARLLRREGEGINLDEIEDVFSAGLRREIVIDPGEQSVAAKLPGVPLAFELMVSARFRRCSRVWRGRMLERPKPSVVLRTTVRGSVVLLLDCCRSRENWARKWLISRQENVLVRETDAVSVATCS
jgi:hypothetical protein